MEIGSSTTPSQTSQLHEMLARVETQSEDFSIALQQATGGASAADGATGAGSASASGSSWQLSGSFQSFSLIAVGTITDGQFTPFSQQQVQGEETLVNNMREAAFSDSLQNFLMLAQAGSTNGQASSCSYSDQQQFVGDNGFVSASFDTSLSLQTTASGNSA